MPISEKWLLVFGGINWNIYRTDPLNYALINKDFLKRNNPTEYVHGWYGSLFGCLRVLVKKEFEYLIYNKAEELQKLDSLISKITFIETQLNTFAKKIFTCLSENLEENDASIQDEIRILVQTARDFKEKEVQETSQVKILREDLFFQKLGGDNH